MSNSYTINRFIINSIEPDYVDQQAPENVFNDGANVRYNNNIIERVSGYTPIFGTLLNTPIYVMGIREFNEFKWLYASTSNIGVVNSSSTHFSLTPVAGVIATKQDNWSGGVMNSLVFMCSPLTDPIYWDGNTSNKMLTLPNWPSSTKAKCIRAYKNFLVAMAIDNASGFYGNMIKWSASADSGDIPQSWDETDATLDAGEATLSTTSGNIIDCLPLQDNNVIYKDDSTHLMKYIGGQFIFAFTDLFVTSGIMGRDCVVEINGTHIVLTKDDVIRHDGHTFKSIVTNRIRDFIFESINTAYASNSYLAHNRKRNEIWICIPIGDGDTPQLAIIWNYKLDKFGIRNLPSAGVSFIASGLVDITTDTLTWNTDIESWVEDPTIWNEQYINDISNDLVFPLSTKLMQLDITENDETNPISAYVEKRSIKLSNESEIALVVRLIPNLEGVTGNTLRIRVGGQINITDPILWDTERDFIIGTDIVHDCLVKGRYISIKISSIGGGVWKLFSVGLEFNSNERH